MKIEILGLARQDLVDGYCFYEEREPGLGSYFLDSLFSDIDSLQIHGGVHRLAYRNLHRALSKRFPFAIYYTFDGAVVRVRAVVDCRRSPSWIRKHLGGT